METQVSNRVLMVKPATFYFNEETAENNSFQIAPTNSSKKCEIHEKAISEFSNLVEILRNAGVTVEVIEEEPEPVTTDSVFPNNWISFHCESSGTAAEENAIDGITFVEDQTAVLYPMWSKNRQVERKKLFPQVVKLLPSGTNILDLSRLEEKERFLEGTGSMVLDRGNKIVYACLSPRTGRDTVDLFCRRMGYKPVIFNGTDSQGQPCYHTNVMMSIADKYCVICLEAIPDLGERVEVEVSLQNLGKVIIPLNLDQMNNFAGNCLQLKGTEGTFLVMSSRAFNSFSDEQIKMIGQFDKILHADVETIENFGGGSVRCMIAEMGEIN